MAVGRDYTAVDGLGQQHVWYMLDSVDITGRADGITPMIAWVLVNIMCYVFSDRSVHWPVSG